MTNLVWIGVMKLIFGKRRDDGKFDWGCRRRRSDSKDSFRDFDNHVEG
jgi:hypothetical protein